RILGRTTLETIYRPGSDEVICAEGEVFDERRVRLVEEAGIQRVKIRSVLTCEALRGICANCYGRDLARGNMVDVGEAVGIIAAQSIGEPGTQLTMRTFHIGGVATGMQSEQTALQASFGGKVHFEDLQSVPRGERQIVMNRHSRIILLDERDRPREQYDLNYGSELLVKEGDMVEPGTTLSEWDPYTIPILSEVDGTVEFGDIIEGVTMVVRLDELTGHSSMVVQETRDADARPRIAIRGADGEISTYQGREARYFLPVGASISVDEGQEIKAGDALAKMPRETTKTKDITGGLPRVVELFEARTPKDHAIIAETDGVVSFGKDKGGKRRIIVTPEGGEPREYLVPKGRHIQ